MAASLIASNLMTYLYIKKTKDAEYENRTAENNKTDYQVKRLSGYSYIKPILFVDEKYASENLNGIKQNVATIIENYKKIGVLSSASFYLKEFNSNGWTGLNENEKFMPGSLMKVPELIAFLKMNELKPGTLDKVIAYDHVNQIGRQTTFNSKSIQPGNKYTIRELLEYMIKYSDNQATALLNQNVDKEIFGKVFTDLGLELPDWQSSNYPISVREFSVFMRGLYSGSYLNHNSSEIAAKLLSTSQFKLGIKAGLPANQTLAHKFGEAGKADEKQLSESAIIYLEGNPYVITVMVGGKDHSQLPVVIKDISGSVYQYMKTNIQSGS